MMSKRTRQYIGILLAIVTNYSDPCTGNRGILHLQWEQRAH